MALGILLRIARYLMDYPLWWDEAFVGANLLRRGYLDLLKPLDYGQVCPLLFLWAELTAVTLLGFSEWSLRLFPLGCAVASVVLFRHAAGRVLNGVPLATAVGIFAVSYHPIRHAADVKPYASDLLVALVLLAIVLEWLREPGRSRWLWALAAITPFGLALSYPAVFVAGGIGMAVGPAVYRTRRATVGVAYLAGLASTGLSFASLYLLFTRGQTAATLPGMSEQWVTGFPPMDSLASVVAWLARVHTGSMFAYPCGGERGASVLTLLAFATGAAWLWRRGDRTIVGLCLAPFGLAILAAALRRYPYGGVTHGSPARVVQYLAPAICLLAGAGVSAWLARVADPRRTARLLGLGGLALAVIGVAPIVAEARRPYRSTQAFRAREFARTFWPEVSRGAEPVCLRWDLGLGPWDSTDLNLAVYLCNQKIYAPARSKGEPPHWASASEARPLRCVEPLAREGDARVLAWRRTMADRYELRSAREVMIDTAEPGARPRSERYVVYTYVPKPPSPCPNLISRLPRIAQRE